MNKLGVHALVWEAGWSHEEAARAIANTAEVGFDFIEIPALDPASIDTAFTRRELERAGIGCSFSLGLDAGALQLAAREGGIDRGRIERRDLDEVETHLGRVRDRARGFLVAPAGLPDQCMYAQLVHSLSLCRRDAGAATGDRGPRSRMRDGSPPCAQAQRASITASRKAPHRAVARC
ncbi:hypothetical protein PPH41_42320, partial [Burkholderia gladioli]|nr:hypothetical protein [Burkholderia gladioli]